MTQCETMRKIGWDDDVCDIPIAHGHFKRVRLGDLGTDEQEREYRLALARLKAYDHMFSVCYAPQPPLPPKEIPLKEAA